MRAFASARAAVARGCSTALGYLATLSRPWFYLSMSWLVVIVATGALAPARIPHVDFDAFYCGGRAVASHQDPYRESPLNACERQVEFRGPIVSGATIPAPLPPFALALFSPLSRLPAEAAYRWFTVVSLLALCIATVLLSRLADAPIILVLAAIAPSAYDDLLKGQPVPLIFLALVAAGWWLRHERVHLAALAAASTLIEPHIGIPVCVAFFLWVPRARLALTIPAAVLAAVSFLSMPAGIVLAYATAVLPQQASSEAVWATQLSFTHLMWILGAPPGLALLLGSIQYIACVAAIVALAPTIARRSGAKEMMLFAPALVAVLGGTYLHNSAMLMAVPAAVVTARTSRNIVAYVALIALSQYWLLAGDPFLLLLMALSAFSIMYAREERLGVSVIAALLVAAIGSVYAAHPAKFTINVEGITVNPRDLAEVSWGRFVRLANPAATDQWKATIMKVPTWAGLLFVWILSTRSLQGSTATEDRA